MWLWCSWSCVLVFSLEMKHISQSGIFLLTLPRIESEQHIFHVKAQWTQKFHWNKTGYDVSLSVNRELLLSDLIFTVGIKCLRSFLHASRSYLKFLWFHFLLYILAALQDFNITPVCLKYTSLISYQ